MTNDPYLWLEDVSGSEALNWVERQNTKTISTLKEHKYFDKIYDNTLQILNSNKRIAYPTIRGEYVYNFWQDKHRERGVWRRMLREDYFAGNTWEELLDIDRLAKTEKKPWVFKGAFGLYPDYNRYMIKLSVGGGDATIIREFDIKTKSFVAEGFYVPEAKSSLAWIDIDTLWISTDFGEESLTESGYPRSVREWKRGQKLQDAQVVFDGDTSDIIVYGFAMRSKEKMYKIIMQAKTFYKANYFACEKGELKRLMLPEDCSLYGFIQNFLVFRLKSDWQVQEKLYPQGSILSICYDDFLCGKHNFLLVITPQKNETIVSVELSKNFIIVSKLKDVRSELYKYDIRSQQLQKVDTPKYGSIHLVSSDDESDCFFYTYSDFLTPPTLYFKTDQSIKQVIQLPHFFSTQAFKVEQFMAITSDGVNVPYFVIANKEITLDGKNPCLIKAYGGFEVSLYPHYLGSAGMSWLEYGGVYVIANIRGGGEFGPQWHRAALKENRQRAFDDLYSVSEDIISRKISSPSHLGIMGASNGGLLVGTAFTQRPELYNAVVCQVPLLDMKRYHKLLAGASWVAEYGNPDIPEEWAYICKYSPYHNIQENKKYPRIFIHTSTKDDRVHPGHARKMTAKLQEMNHQVYYYENTEGGHAGATTHQQQAFVAALSYCYLWQQLHRT